MAKIQKFSGIFHNVGDIVRIEVPPEGETVLRLYQLTKEIALFYAVPTVDESAPAIVPTTRYFQASDAKGNLPDNFVKYIGVIGLPKPNSTTGQFEEVYVVEVTGPAPHGGPTT